MRHFWRRIITLRMLLGYNIDFSNKAIHLNVKNNNGNASKSKTNMNYSATLFVLFQAYEKGIGLFRWPLVFDVWNIYLTKFIDRYVRSSQLPRTLKPQI